MSQYNRSATRQGIKDREDLPGYRYRMLQRGAWWTTVFCVGTIILVELLRR